MVCGMNSENTVAIVAPNATERRSLSQLLASEGFSVEAFSSVEKFGIIPTRSGCMIVDLDLPGDDAAEQSLLNFAKRRSRELPVIVIASDPNRLPDDSLLPGIAKSAGENHLLYLIYGALSEPASSPSRAQAIS
jgi:CheY-like chemotaxis protein